MPMRYSFKIDAASLDEFVKHWASKYEYSNPELYFDNIGKRLTQQRIEALFEWKNGSKLSKKKMASVRQNYLPGFNGDVAARYLQASESGGAIWNIFYAHCLAPESWPIFDQHTYRAMRYMKSGEIVELPQSRSKVYEIYRSEYIPFMSHFRDHSKREVDKALFSFGQFLKTAGRYA